MNFTSSGSPSCGSSAPQAKVVPQHKLKTALKKYFFYNDGAGLRISTYSIFGFKRDLHSDNSQFFNLNILLNLISFTQSSAPSAWIWIRPLLGFTLVA